MEVTNEDQTPFEICVVVPKRIVDQIGEGYGYDCVELLVDEFHKIGLIVDKVTGLHDEFLKLAAPVEVLGKTAAELQLKKRTQIGVDLQFEWDESDAFIRQADGSLFSWCERFRCYNHMIDGIVNKSESAMILKSNCRDVRWEPGEPLVWKLEKEAIIKEVFPIHDEIKRKQLLKRWALNLWDFTNQPLDEIYTYYGAKIATYFAFLGMYTKWMFFPAAFGLVLQLVDFGSLQLFVLPFFFICVVSWAVLFFQFWKRKNSTLLARWQVCYSVGAESAYKYMDTEWSLFHSSVELINKSGADKVKEKEKFQREEWFGHLTRFRNDAVVILSIICLQLPFELAYAHLYERIKSDILKFGLTALYLFAIQYFTQIGGRVSVKLINKEKNENSEYRANSLVYKVFGLYFMQSYIGILYHAILHRNFMTLRQVIIQRLIISEVLENLVENSLPYIKYSYRKYRAVRNKKKLNKGMATRKSYFNSRVEKEYFKPIYSASVGGELEDGLFDEFLELALQFGMIMMFACAFPPAFAFAALNNITEIRADALKILAMYRRPVPRVAATIGAWLNIFQVLLQILIPFIYEKGLIFTDRGFPVVWHRDSVGFISVFVSLEPHLEPPFLVVLDLGGLVSNLSILGMVILFYIFRLYLVFIVVSDVKVIGSCYASVVCSDLVDEERGLGDKNVVCKGESISSFHDLFGRSLLLPVAGAIWPELFVSADVSSWCQFGPDNSSWCQFGPDNSTGTTVRVEFGDATTVADSSGAHAISQSFPHSYGQPLGHFLRATAKVPRVQIISDHPAIKVGLVFCGGQSPG